MPAKIIPILTATGTRYAVVVGQRPLTDFPTMSQAAMWAIEMGLEVSER